MVRDLSRVDWAQVRHAYEHTEEPIPDICAEHGISSNTLRDRMRRWGWTRRQAPVPREGPPPVPARIMMEPLVPLPPPAPCASEPAGPATAAPSAEAPCGPATPYAEAGAPAADAPDAGAMVPRLQSAVARVLPAIEATLSKLAAGPMPPRELERSGRALAALTRTLRELNGLLAQHQTTAAGAAAADDDDDMPEDIDAFRLDLARRRAFKTSRDAARDGKENHVRVCLHA